MENTFLKNYKFACILILILLNSHFIFSQSAFQFRLGTGNDELGLRIITWKDSSYIIASAINAPNAGFILTKMDMNGQMRWSKVYYDSLNISFFSMIMTYDSCLMVLSDRHPTQQYSDLMLSKIDSSGNVLWSKSYSTSNTLFGTNDESIHETKDHGIIISSYSFVQSPGTILLIKTDSSGNILWSNSYNFGANDFIGSAILELDDGNFLFSTSGMDQATGQISFWLFAKLDSAGYVINLNNSTQKWDGLQSSKFFSMTDGNFILINAHTIACIDSNANPVWIKEYTSPLVTNSSVRLSNNQFAITGLSSTHNSTGDVLLLKADSLGNILSSVEIGGLQTDCGYSLCETSHGRIAITGKTNSFNSNAMDIYVLQSDSAGDFGCQRPPVSITNTQSPIPYFPDSVLVTGVSITQNAVQISDSMITLSQDNICNNTGIKENEFAFDITLLPNPFSESAMINLGKSLPLVIVTVSNTLGQVVKQIESENVSSVEIKINDAPGLYFVKVADGSRSRLFRIIKL